MSLLRHRQIATGLAALAIGGCGAGSGAGLDANGQPITSGGGTGPLTADFQSIQNNIFTPICTKCHIGAGAPEGLQLDAAHSYALLVGVPSAENGALLRVKPGDPANSYIVLKLQGSPGIVGGQMPLGGPYLPQSTINVIRQWITNGAPQAAAATVAATSASTRADASAATFVVTTTSPVNDAIATEPVPRIVVAFNHEVDASLVNNTTISLERVSTADGNSSNDATGATAASAMAAMDSLATSTALAQGNPASIVITPATPLGAGAYRVTVRGTGGGALADVNARGLGVDYSFSFTVDLSL